MLAALLVFGGGSDEKNHGLPNPPLGILLEGGTSQLCVELADDSPERAQGLSGRKTIGDYDGMAFIFSGDAAMALASVGAEISPSTAPESLLVSTSFWMRDTHIPLDLIFVGADGRVRGVATMDPCPDGKCRSYPPPEPYLYAVELPAGWAREFGISRGTVLRLGGSCLPFDRD